MQGRRSSFSACGIVRGINKNYLLVPVAPYSAGPAIAGELPIFQTGRPPDI